MAGLQDIWAKAGTKNVGLKCIVHTHDRGAVNLSPWLMRAAWGNNIAQGAPTFEATFCEPKRAATGTSIATKVMGTPLETIDWIRSKALWRSLRSGDWVQFHVNLGRPIGEVPNYLGWVGDVGGPDRETDDDGRTMTTTSLSGEAVNCVLDLPIVAHPALKGLPSYFNLLENTEVSVAFASGLPNLILATCLSQMFTHGGTYPRMPWSLHESAAATGLAGIINMLPALESVIDGSVVETQPKQLVPAERRTIRSIIGPYLGIPELAEMFIEYRPVFPESPVWDLQLVYRMHPWDRLDWMTLPVTDVDCTSMNLSAGSGAYFNYYNTIPVLPVIGPDHTQVGESPFIPIVDIDGLYKYGFSPLEVELRWGDPKTFPPAPTTAYIERMNKRLWEWWSLGRTYLQGTLNTHWRPDIRCGQKIRAKMETGETYTFYVEGYHHQVEVNQAETIVTGRTQLAVTRGQPGDYQQPDMPPAVMVETWVPTGVA